MNISITHPITFLGIVLPTLSFGQSIECGSARPATSACSFDSYCDSSAMRDLWQPSASTPLLVIRLGFVVFRDDVGDNEAVSESRLAANFDQLNDDFLDYGIQFDWVNPEPNDYFITSWNFNHYDDYCDPIPSGFVGCDCPVDGDLSCDPGDYVEAAMLLYGTTQADLDPASSLNVFISLQGKNEGEFPWFDDVNTYLSGIKINGSKIGGEFDCGSETCHSLTHEVGHVFGLFHTHEGAGYGSACTDCIEPGSCDGTCGDEECDEYGDLCCDTAATGLHLGCEGFFGGGPGFCIPGAWEYVDASNYMGYGGDGCWDHFTPQQVSRMHCWVCNAHPEWIVNNDDCNENEIPDVCEITRGDATDCDENGIPDECDGLGSCCGPSEFCHECMTEEMCDLLYGIWGPPGNCMICAMLTTPPEE